MRFLRQVFGHFYIFLQAPLCLNSLHSTWLSIKISAASMMYVHSLQAYCESRRSWHTKTNVMIMNNFNILSWSSSSFAFSSAGENVRLKISHLVQFNMFVSCLINLPTCVQQSNFHLTFLKWIFISLKTGTEILSVINSPSVLPSFWWCCLFFISYCAVFLMCLVVAQHQQEHW